MTMTISGLRCLQAHGERIFKNFDECEFSCPFTCARPGQPCLHAAALGVAQRHFEEWKGCELAP